MKGLKHFGSIFFRVIFFALLLGLQCVWAGSPVFQFTPLTSTTVRVDASESAIVQYRIKNLSRKSHTLQMSAISGVTQQTTVGNCGLVFSLAHNQSCILTLRIDGSQITGDIYGGPVVCQVNTGNQSNALLCYRPTSADSLAIIYGPSGTQYVVTSSAGPQGSMTPDTPQIVASGGAIMYTATPNSGYQVYQWLVDGGVAQAGGNIFELYNITSNHVVSVTFTQSGTIYVGTQAGEVYFSSGNGSGWYLTMNEPPGVSGVSSVFSSPHYLYATRGEGVNYSADSGVNWSSTATPWGGTRVNAIFVLNQDEHDILYVALENGEIQMSSDQGDNWHVVHTFSAAAKSLFIKPGDTSLTNQFYVGLFNGRVHYSADNGVTWDEYPLTPDGTSITDVFATNTRLFVNTADEYTYTNRSLTPGGTWDTYAQSVYSLFVNADESVIDAGSQGGFVYSLLTGDSLGFMSQSPVNSIFFSQG